MAHSKKIGPVQGGFRKEAARVDFLSRSKRGDFTELEYGAAIQKVVAREISEATSASDEEQIAAWLKTHKPKRLPPGQASGVKPSDKRAMRSRTETKRRWQRLKGRKGR